LLVDREVEELTDNQKTVYETEVQVKPQSFLRVIISSSHAGDRVSKGMVFSVQFFNSEDKEIKYNHLNFSKSINYSNYRYVLTGNYGSPNKEQISILTPISATYIKMKLIQWTFLSDPKGEIETLSDNQRYEAKLADNPFEIFFSCNQFWSYTSSFKFINSQRNIGRIGILLVRYFTQDNRPLTPQSKEQLSWSEEYQAYFKYYSSGQGELVIEHEHKFHPPEGAVLVEVRVSQWNESEVEFECSTPIETSLQWDHTDKKGLLNESMISHLSHSISLEKRTELSSSVSSRQHHDLLYDSYIQTGDLQSALSAVEIEYQSKPTKRTLHRLTYIAQMIKSLDLDWFPILSSSKKLTKTPGLNKILHMFKVTYPFESTGGSIRNLNIVESQKNIGIEPIVVTPLNYPRTFGVTDFKHQETIRGVRHIRFDTGDIHFQSASYICENLQLNTQLLAGLIRTENPEILHAASGYKGYELATMAKVLSEHFSIPWVYEVRSFHEHTWTKDIFYANNSWHTKQRILKENSLMMHATQVVTISESMKEALIDRGIPAEKITIVPNAVDIDSFLPGQKSKKLIKRLKLEKKKILGYISNISIREGHEVLIRSLPLILEEHPDAVIMIVGDGPEKDNLIQIVSELEIEEKVLFTGKVDHSEIQDYYRLIDLFIVPRKRDYASDLVTPLKPYEAMALEVPLIVSDRKALIEIIGKDRGYSFKTEDPEDLANLVCYCLNNMDECKSRAKTARAWLIKNRTWEKNAQLYRKLYENIRREWANDK